MLPISQTSPVPSQRSLIPINIETLAGSSFELLVSPYEQIQYIKRKIERREGIPVSHQHLIWKSNELEDESCLYDYKIEAGTTLKLVLAMRGGPVNTKRVPIEDSFIREMSEYIENSRDDYTLTSDLLPSSNKNVTFLVLRDGDQFNFFQVIDRGDGTLSPLSGSMSNTSMYNTHETMTVEQERKYDEKRQADDRKTKEKMESIRSKLKTHTRKDVLPVRPSSTSKQKKTNLIHHHRRNILVDSSSNISTHGDNSSGTSSLEPQKQSCSVPYQLSSTNLINTYNMLAAATTVGQSIYLHEEDSEDEEDSHDEDDDQQQLENNQQEKILSSLPTTLVKEKKQQLLTSRSYSPSGFYQKKHHSYEQESSKKSLQDSYYYGHNRKNRIGQHNSTNTLGTYMQNSNNTLFSTNCPSTTIGPVSQETAITTITTSENDTNTGAILVDNINSVLPTLDQQSIPIVSTSSRILSATMNKNFNTSDELKSNNIDSILDNQDEKINSNSEIIYQQSHTSPMLELLDDDIITPTNGLTSATSIHDDKTEPYRKRTAEIQSRNDTSLSKPIWTDDDDQLIIGDEYTIGERTSTSQSILFRHRNSSTSTTIATPVPTFPNVVKKSTLPSTTQQFYHYHKTLNNDTKQTKSSPRPLIPLTLSKYRRMPSNLHLTTTTSSLSQQQTYTNTSNSPSNDLTNNDNGNGNNSTDSYNEHLILNKRIEVLKTPGKKQSTPSTMSSPSSSSTTIFPPASTSSKRHFQQQDIKSIGATATVPPPSSSSSSRNPLDNTKVTIETIGSKTVSALLRQNATIEPVDTSRGVGKHLVSLLTTASKDTTSIKTGYKPSSRDAVIEERYKLDPKLNNLWSSPTSNNLSTVSSSLQSSKLPPVIVNRKSTSKCFLCKKKTGLATTYQCKCGSSFCSEHRYPEAHACAFDYKAEGKRLIERNNPLVTAPKLPKI
ncbi:unnamed protein product [Rotaria sp. Silwood1]|nr:unnamed protein product [Rotaria sp. Silwood1]CAF3504432.1 unnamed protein product [Rotaria sp. Silwood1]CAF4681508.1 unnamed protein product [Rotaria sp. Silwood1]CAF4689032.1 unnamed protein product [Rotaria sp. Silwood1]